MVRMRVCIDGDMRQLPKLFAACTSFCERWGVDAAVSGGLAVVVDEVSSNIIRHGFAPVPEDGGHRSAPKVRPKVHMSLLYRSRVLQAIFADNGRPFNPLSALSERRDPKGEHGGYGLYLVAAFADALAYRQGRGCNVLILHKVVKSA